MFLSLTNTGGAKIMPILPTLLHHTPRALCGSVEINTDSLVKGMILFDQGGEGEEGEKGHGRKALPSISPWSTCFLLLLARRIILVGNSPAGPPSCISRRHTMVVIVVFVGWSTALLSRVSVLFLRKQTYNKLDNKYSTKL